MQNVKVTRKGVAGKVAARLFILFAREAPTAVIFRRGPSHWVQVIKWNTNDDTFEEGQWFHGRLYERRSDLSPDGKLLIYFVNKINDRTLSDEEYTYAWTAISKPPYLTALALWPKGDCWHGGGLFLDDIRVELNHRSDRKTPHPNHKPDGIRVVLRENVQGEDEPLYSERLERDGWALRQTWQTEYRGLPDMYQTLQPELREKRGPDGMSIQLKRSIQHLDYSEEFLLASDDGSFSTSIEGASWVDWDQNGRLILAVEGKVFAGTISAAGSLTKRELIDLNNNKPQQIVSPESARIWGPERVAKKGHRTPAPL